MILLAIAPKFTGTLSNEYKYPVHVHNIHSLATFHSLFSLRRKFFRPLSQFLTFVTSTCSSWSSKRAGNLSLRSVNTNLTVAASTQSFNSKDGISEYLLLITSRVNLAKNLSRFLWYKPSKFPHFWLIENSKPEKLLPPSYVAKETPHLREKAISWNI